MSPHTTLLFQISHQLDAYLAAFNSGSFTAAAAHYHEPSSLISADGVVLLPTRKEVSDLLTSTTVRLRRDGFHHSEWAGEKKIVVLDLGEGDGNGGFKKGLVVASCPFRRLRGDGSVVEEFCGTYMLRSLPEGEWRIVSATQHAFGKRLK